eukprot:Nk52_evm12s208 gene=Nk52_evmTU12s208
MFRAVFFILVPAGLITLSVILFYSVVIELTDAIFDASSNPAVEKRAGEFLTTDLGEKAGNLFWFVHISDIHLSKFRADDRTADFREFTGNFLQNGISPEFVLVTGDVTDAKGADHISSQQYTEEWETYHNILKENGILDRENFWFDVRGNHDSFDVPSFEDPNVNLFRKYSVKKSLYFDFVYRRRWKHKDFFYKIIGFDASPVPGTRRPFNFFGHVSNDVMDQLEDSLSQSSKDNRVKHTFVMGHYPLSVLTSQTAVHSGMSVQQLLDRHASMYFCGHLHTLFGLVPKMHMRHRGGMLELEVGDWKDHRKYRIVVIDNGLVSFVDLKFPSSRGVDSAENRECEKARPVVVISNPKNGLYAMPKKEPYELVATSSHIRILVFLPNSNLALGEVIEGGKDKYCHSVKHLKVFIDGDFIGTASTFWQNGTRDDDFAGKLFTLGWEPSKLSPGLHKIKAELMLENNESGRKAKWFFEQPFSVDGTLAHSWNILPRIVLRCDLTVVGKIAFICLYITIVGGLLIFPKAVGMWKMEKGVYGQWKVELFYRSVGIRETSKVKEGCKNKTGKTKYSPTFVNIMVRKFGSSYMGRREWLKRIDRLLLQCVVLSELGEIYYPLVGYGLYLACGPWFIGSLHSQTSTGLLFIFGGYIDGQVLSLSLTYFYGLMYLLFVYLPLILYLLAKCVYIPSGITSSAALLPSSSPNQKRRGSIDTSGSEMNMATKRVQKKALKVGAADITMMFFLAYQMFTCIELYHTYGWVTVLLSPVKVWFIVMSFYLIYRIRCLQMRADFCLDYMRLGKLS